MDGVKPRVCGEENCSTEITVGISAGPGMGQADGLCVVPRRDHAGSSGRFNRNAVELRDGCGTGITVGVSVGAAVEITMEDAGTISQSGALIDLH